MHGCILNERDLILDRETSWHETDLIENMVSNSSSNICRNLRTQQMSVDA
jgi:hypothetical protein